MEPSADLSGCRWMQTSYIIIFIVNSVMRMNLDSAQSLFRPVNAICCCWETINRRAPYPGHSERHRFLLSGSIKEQPPLARPISIRDDQSFAGALLGLGVKKFPIITATCYAVSRGNRGAQYGCLRSKTHSVYLSIRDRLSIMQMLPAIDLPPLAPASRVPYCLFPWRWSDEPGRH